MCYFIILLLFLFCLKKYYKNSVIDDDKEQCSNEYSNIFEYSNTFLRILIFVFDSWYFLKTNIIRIFEYFVQIFSNIGL